MINIADIVDIFQIDFTNSAISKYTMQIWNIFKENWLQKCFMELDTFTLILGLWTIQSLTSKLMR